MAKIDKRRKVAGISKKEPIKYFHIFFLILFGIITVLTPSLGALDSNGPKFLMLSLLNLVVFVFLIVHKDFRTKSGNSTSFFFHTVGFIYSLFLIVSLLSFFKAINILESVLHFTKIFTTFFSAYLISILISKERRGLVVLSVILSIILIYDSYSVFVGIVDYINGKIGNISDIKSVYSNKNILASAIFVKMPFALWVMLFKKKWLRVLGVIALGLAQMATLFMSTRAFYLGLVVLCIVLLIYLIKRYVYCKNREYIKSLVIYSFLLIVAFSIFSVTQKYFYPTTGSGYNVGFAARLETANTEDTSARKRLDAWKRSWHLIEKNPILGVGLGNWKVDALKEENLTSPNYILMYKNHNDFIETAAETGLIGGFLLLSIFIIVFWKYGRKLIQSQIEADESWYFLIVFGLIAYGFDAFFNFPQDRPEIAGLFSIYIGIAATLPDKGIFNKKLDLVIHQKTKGPILKWGLTVITIILLLISSYALYLNLASLRIQTVIHSEVTHGKLNASSSQIINVLPWFPDINVVGEPIAVQKARYLVNENKNDEALRVLKADHSSPYDGRKEFFMSMAYDQKNELDSATFYAEKLYEMKPFFFVNIRHLCSLLVKKEKADEGKQILDHYLTLNKRNPDAWLYSYTYYLALGEMGKASALLDSASFYMPENQTIENQSNLGLRFDDIFYDESFEKAIDAYNNKEYEGAATLFSLLINSKECDECHIRRAFCYYSMKEYEKSIQDLEYLINKGIKQANIFNLIGVDYYLVNDSNNACKYFEMAKDLGDPQGIINYRRYCENAQ